MATGYLSTPIGWLKLTATQRLLTSVEPVDAPEAGTENLVIHTAKQQLTEYFAGTRREFSVPFRYPTATPFQIRVWDALQQVPYGKTITYGQLAAAIGQPGAARAVGLAVGQNPLMILLPCHRVVAVNGLGGFRWGQEIKRALINLEDAFLNV